MSSNSSILFGLRSNGGQHGDVCTSPEVVRYMLDEVGYTADQNLSGVRILEPSSGEGEFVVEIARRLQLSASHFHFDVNEAFLRNVRAYDIDAKKIERCRNRVGQLGIASVEAIRVADFLKTEREETDIVVGNPPYVRYEKIPKEMIDFCRSAFSTFHYRSDLYVPFFEKTLAALAPDGVHCFICSNRWFKNEYGKKLRHLIATQYQLRTIINLEHSDAFQEDVLAYPAITVMSAGGRSERFGYAECGRVEALVHTRTSQRVMPKDGDWTVAFSTLPDRPSFMTIEQQGFKIGIGVATGADAIFISRDLPQKVESELIMPGINARDLRGNRFQWQGEYLLNPYNRDGSLVNLSDYPRANAYLERHRERLAARHIAKKSPSRWYKTIDRISPSLLSQPKILLPDMSGNTFVFVDEGTFYPLHNIYYIIGSTSDQLRLLAAFLMSDFVRNQLAAVSNQMNGGFSRWQSQHLRKLRLPNLNALPASEAKQILAYYERREISKINSTINRFLATA